MITQFILAAFAAIFFGIWQQNGFAGCFMAELLAFAIVCIEQLKEKS